MHCLKELVGCVCVCVCVCGGGVLRFEGVETSFEDLGDVGCVTIFKVLRDVRPVLKVFVMQEQFFCLSVSVHDAVRPT